MGSGRKAYTRLLLGTRVLHIVPTGTIDRTYRYDRVRMCESQGIAVIAPGKERVTTWEHHTTLTERQACETRAIVLPVICAGDLTHVVESMKEPIARTFHRAD